MQTYGVRYPSNNVPTQFCYYGMLKNKTKKQTNPKQKFFNGSRIHFVRWVFAVLVMMEG